MELLLLWRWSTLVQVSSDLLIAVFFVALAHSLRRVELRPWVGAWLANLAALSVTILFWLLQPQSRWAFVVLASLYLFAKVLFLLLLIDGALEFVAKRVRPIVNATSAAVVALACAIGCALLPSIDLLGVVGASTISVCMAACAILVAKSRAPVGGWLVTGCALRSLLAAAEAAAFWMKWSTGDNGGTGALAAFLASHSSFDTGVEWVIALGCVLMLHRTIQRELERANGDLMSAKEALQVMLDHDQLTGAFSRRAMPTLLRAAQATGGTVLFFDLDGFKAVNDRRGHQFGDVCLTRFANELRAHFPADRVIRYAGDEFIVVTQDREPSRLTDRIAAMRSALDAKPVDGLRIAFSVGTANLLAQGDAQAALRAADEAMYTEKAARAA
jgi:diguanylate cyclase (GGDEF)-like protein